jgi:hypothetical protein
VVVALVVVLFRPVKFWRVEEPFTWTLERVVRPPVAVTVPVKLVAAEIVWPLIVPEVVTLPVLREVAKRLVEEAVVAKEFVLEKLVVVALLPVAFMKVKFWRVVEPRARNWPVVVAPPLMTRPPVLVPLPMVEEAVESKPTRVGVLAKTAAPVPVSSVRAVARFAEVGVMRKFKIPAPKPPM